MATLTPPYVPPAPPSLPEVKVHPPVVYVQPEWEYRIVTGDASPNESDLNALGGEGWELVGVVPLPNGVQLYFKRLVR